MASSTYDSKVVAESTLTHSPLGFTYNDVSATASPNETSSNVTANGTGTDAALPPRNEELAKIEIAVQAIILCLAILGNGLVLLILTLRRKKLSRMNMMIVHLSLADLFVAFFNVLPQLVWDITDGQFIGGDFLCRSVKYFQVVAMYASSYVLVTTAIDRYLAICHPLTAQTWSSRKTHLMVAMAWGLSLALSVPQVIIFSFTVTQDGTYNCWANFDPMWTLKLYITFITMAIYVLPFLILAGAYGRICMVVWKSMMAKEPSKRLTKRSNPDRAENGTLLGAQNGNKNITSKPRAHVRGMSRAKVRTVKLTLTVIICYLICWGPFFVTQMWAAWDPFAPFQGNAMVIIMLLASLNSCTNPWVYVAFSDQLLQQFARCLRGRHYRPDRPSGFDSESRMRSTAMSTTEFSRLEPSFYSSSQSHYRSDKL